MPLRSVLRGLGGVGGAHLICCLSSDVIVYHITRIVLQHGEAQRQQVRSLSVSRRATTCERNRQSQYPPARREISLTMDLQMGACLGIFLVVTMKLEGLETY